MLRSSICLTKPDFFKNSIKYTGVTKVKANASTNKFSKIPFNVVINEVVKKLGQIMLLCKGAREMDQFLTKSNLPSSVFSSFGFAF